MPQPHLHETARPFDQSPIPLAWSNGSNHDQVLKHLTRGLSNGERLMWLTGEAGVGKTAVALRWMHSADPATTLVVPLTGSGLTLAHLFDRLTEVLDVHADVSDGDLSMLIDAVTTALDEQRQAGRIVVLLIDDAEQLTSDSLRSLRLFIRQGSQLEGKVKLALVGRPELQSVMEENEDLAGLVSHKLELRPLSHKQTLSYLRLRLRDTETAEFTRSALDRVARCAGGIPRAANAIASRALVASVEEGALTVTAERVQEVLRQCRPPHRNGKIWHGLVAAVMLLTLASIPAWHHKGELFRTLDQTAQQFFGQGISQGKRAQLAWLTPTYDPPWQVLEQGAPQDGVLEEAAETNAEQPEEAAATVLTVEPGDSLATMAKRVYGRFDAELMDNILRANPQMADPNVISVGQRIAFPSI